MDAMSAPCARTGRRRRRACRSCCSPGSGRFAPSPRPGRACGCVKRLARHLVPDRIYDVGLQQERPALAWNGNVRLAANQRRVATNLSRSKPSTRSPPMPSDRPPTRRHPGQRADDSSERARSAPRRLDRDSVPVTVVAVARAAAVSRALLYRDPDLGVEIERLRSPAHSQARTFPRSGARATLHSDSASTASTIRSTPGSGWLRRVLGPDLYRNPYVPNDAGRWAGDIVSTQSGKPMPRWRSPEDLRFLSMI